MKAFALALCLLLSAGCGSKSDDAQPPAWPAAVTYTGPSGAAVTVTSTAVYSVTAAPTRPGEVRRALGVRATLSNGYVLNVTYEYLGNAFPDHEGPIPLETAIKVAYELNQQAVSVYTAPVAAGTVRVDSVNPQLVSGTYSGPLTAGGPAVSFAFNRLPI